MEEKKYTPEEAAKILMNVLKQQLGSKAEAYNDTFKAVKKEINSGKQYFKKEMVADIKRQILNNNEKARHACEVIYAKQTRSEQETKKSVEQNGVGFTKWDASKNGWLIKKAIEKKEQLSDWEWEKLRRMMSKYAEQLWTLAAPTKYKKVGNKWIISEGIVEKNIKKLFEEIKNK
jgi:hypothetical protein